MSWIPGGSRIFSSPSRPDLLFQASVQRIQTIDFPGIRRLVHESDHTPFNAEVVTACSVSSLLYTSPWRLRNYAQRHINFGRLSFQLSLLPPLYSLVFEITFSVKFCCKRDSAEN